MATHANRLPVAGGFALRGVSPLTLLAAGLVAAASSAYFWTLSRLDSAGLLWWLVAIPGLLLQLWLVMWI